MECLLTMRRIYESERGDPRCSPRRGFVLSPKPGAPDVGGHKPFRLQPAGHPPRASTPFADSPAIAYQAVQQVVPPWPCECSSPQHPTIRHAKGAQHVVTARHKTSR